MTPTQIKTKISELQKWLANNPPDHPNRAIVQSDLRQLINKVKEYDFTYKTLLSLDSIAHFLTQGERIIAIRMMLFQDDCDHTDTMAKALRIINKYNWEPPGFKVGQDRITRFYNTETERWELLETYEHEILTEIQKLK